MPNIGNLASMLCSAKTSKRVCVLRCLAVLVGELLLLAWVYTTVQQLHALGNTGLDSAHAALESIQTDQITQVQIADRCVLPANQLQAFVQALHDATNFRVKPDPATYQGLLQITFHSGSIQQYRFYQHPYGIVLELNTNGADLPDVTQEGMPNRNSEYVISATLLSVIDCGQTTALQPGSLRIERHTAPQQVAAQPALVADRLRRARSCAF